MPAPRLTSEELKGVLGRRGYGIASSGIKSTFGQRSVESQIDRSRQEHDLESIACAKPMGAKGIQIKCREKIRVRITFHRRRLADYSRAISEKAIIDCLTKSGIISGDSEREIRLEDGGQKKVETNEEERTELEIDYPEVDYDDLWEEKTF